MRPPRIAAMLLVVLLISGHTAALQVIAWAGMLVDRAPTMSLTSAVRSTFDGTKPCKVCYAVRDLQQFDGQNADRTHRQAPPNKSQWPAPDLAMAMMVELPVASHTGMVQVSSGASPACSAWIAEVPTPPPCRS